MQSAEPEVFVFTLYDCKFMQETLHRNSSESVNFRRRFKANNFLARFACLQFVAAYNFALKSTHFYYHCNSENPESTLVICAEF